MMMRKRFSHGEQMLIRMPQFLNKIVKIEGLAWRLGKHAGDGMFAKKVETVRAFLTTPTIADRKRGTVLLDEPEDGLSLPMQAQLWKILQRVATRFQVIVATQSPLAFVQPHALFIELEDGFVEACRQTLLEQCEPLFKKR